MKGLRRHNCWFGSQHFEEGGGHITLLQVQLLSLHLAPALGVRLNQEEDLTGPHGKGGGGLALKVVQGLDHLLVCVWSLPGEGWRGEVPLILPMFEITDVTMFTPVVNRGPAITLEMVMTVVDAELGGGAEPGLELEGLLQAVVVLLA